VAISRKQGLRSGDFNIVLYGKFLMPIRCKPAIRKPSPNLLDDLAAIALALIPCDDVDANVAVPMVLLTRFGNCKVDALDGHWRYRIDYGFGHCGRFDVGNTGISPWNWGGATFAPCKVL
jgi:hypothetical protein